MTSVPREVRIEGSVVLRPAKPWTPTVHALLHHLHDVGVPVPEPLAIDGSTERVSLLPGEGGDQAWPGDLPVAAARSAGALLRRMHDATVGWVEPPDAVWSVPFSPGEIICHGDPKPGNMAWLGTEAVGLFDWDGARPGERIDDLAYALQWILPVTADRLEAAAASAEVTAAMVARAEAVLSGYGWEGPIDVVTAALDRHQLAIEEVEREGAAGEEPQASWCAEGWPQRWRADLSRARALGMVLPVERGR